MSTSTNRSAAVLYALGSACFVVSAWIAYNVGLAVFTAGLALLMPALVMFADRIDGK